MDLREKETATAVQDLEIRQMELEAQRKRLEQVISFLNPFTAHILFIIHKTFFFSLSNSISKCSFVCSSFC